jgi:hypothetical protein
VIRVRSVGYHIRSTFVLPSHAIFCPSLFPQRTSTSHATKCALVISQPSLQRQYELIGNKFHLNCKGSSKSSDLLGDVELVGKPASSASLTVVVRRHEDGGSAGSTGALPSEPLDLSLRVDLVVPAGVARQQQSSVMGYRGVGQEGGTYLRTAHLTLVLTCLIFLGVAGERQAVRQYPVHPVHRPPMHARPVIRKAAYCRSTNHKSTVSTYPASVLPAAAHLFLPLLGSTTKTKDQVEGRLLLDVVVRKGAALLELLAGEDETLLVRGDTLLVLDPE